MRQTERIGRDGAQRSIGGLLAAWATYWAALLLVALWRPMSLFLRLRQEKPGRGSASVKASSGEGIVARLMEGTSPVWAATISFTELAVWLVGPPLMLWLVWFWWTGRHPGRVPGRVARPSLAPAQPRLDPGEGARLEAIEREAVGAPQRVGMPRDRAG
jgi:hypothetical protein